MQIYHPYLEAYTYHLFVWKNVWMLGCQNKGKIWY